jgi:hypothetical protein
MVQGNLDTRLPIGRSSSLGREKVHLDPILMVSDLILQARDSDTARGSLTTAQLHALAPVTVTMMFTFFTRGREGLRLLKGCCANGAIVIATFEG